MKRFYYLLITIIICSILAINFLPAARNSTRSGVFHLTTGTSTLLSDLSRSIHRKFAFIFNISDLKKQNEFLTEKITQLEVDESRMLELETENGLLKKELGFLDQSEKGSLVPARIIDREPTTFLDSFVVDKGSDDNIVPGAAVTYNGVLVGQIRDVYKNNSKVILITSKDSIVQAMLQDSRAEGILKGGLNGLFMENIISDTDYKEGEYIITSGLGGRMKAGILIGKAGKIQSSSSGIFKSIAVDPVVDLSTLELIFIEKK